MRPSILSCVVLCCALLHFVVACCVELCPVALRCVALCWVVLRCLTCVALCYVLYFVLWCCVMLCSGDLCVVVRASTCLVPPRLCCVMCYVALWRSLCSCSSQHLMSSRSSWRRRDWLRRECSPRSWWTTLAEGMQRKAPRKIGSKTANWFLFLQSSIYLTAGKYIVFLSSCRFSQRSTRPHFDLISLVSVSSVF